MGAPRGSSSNWAGLWGLLGDRLAQHTPNRWTRVQVWPRVRREARFRARWEILCRPLGWESGHVLQHSLVLGVAAVLDGPSQRLDLQLPLPPQQLQRAGVQGPRCQVQAGRGGPRWGNRLCVLLVAGQASGRLEVPSTGVSRQGRGSLLLGLWRVQASLGSHQRCAGGAGPAGPGVPVSPAGLSLGMRPRWHGRLAGFEESTQPGGWPHRHPVTPDGVTL